MKATVLHMQGRTVEAIQEWGTAYAIADRELVGGLLCAKIASFLKEAYGKIGRVDEAKKWSQKLIAILGARMEHRYRKTGE